MPPEQQETQKATQKEKEKPKAKPKAKPKQKIPKALREEVWRVHNHKYYEAKCNIHWCSNKITVFDFEVGHNIPESKGGTLDIDNLRPICSRCNSSMGNHYTIDEWNKFSHEKDKHPVTTACGCW